MHQSTLTSGTNETNHNQWISSHTTATCHLDDMADFIIIPLVNGTLIHNSYMPGIQVILFGLRITSDKLFFTVDFKGIITHVKPCQWDSVV